MTITTIAVMKMNSFFANFNFYFCKHLWWLRLCWWWQQSSLVTMKMMIVTKRNVLFRFYLCSHLRWSPPIDQILRSLKLHQTPKLPIFQQTRVLSFSFVFENLCFPAPNDYFRIQLWIFGADPYIYSKQCWDGELDVNVIKHRSAGNGWIFPSASQKLLWQ